MTIKRATAPVFGFKAIAEEVAGAAGVFEAIVAVFNNVDRIGDRILPGAFAKSLEKWTASGDPIPVIFDHQWGNLDAHIGAVVEAKELPPGDAALPDELKELGGLFVKAELDVDEDFAARVWRKLNKRTLREFSFAYDTVEARSAEVDGETIYDLIELDVIEVGPTLKGMNPATALIGAKARANGKTGAAALIDAVGELGELEDVLDADAIEELVAKLNLDDAGLTDEDDDEEEPPPPATDDDKLDERIAAAVAAGVAEALAAAGSAPAPTGDGTLADDVDDEAKGGGPRSPNGDPHLAELEALAIEAGTL